MRRCTSSLLLATALALAGSAADALPYTGTFVLDMGPLTPVFLSGSGSGDPTLPSISANSFVGVGSVPVTGAAPITQVFLSLTSNAAGAVASGPAFGGLLLGRGFGFGAPLVGADLGGRLGFLSAVLMPVHSGGTGSATAHFGAWTPGFTSVVRTHTLGTAACVASAESPSCPTGMLSGRAANAEFFGGAAQIVLVAPLDLYATTGNVAGVPTFSILALNYVPEPGTLLLLGSGVCGLALAGRRRTGRKR